MKFSKECNLENVKGNDLKDDISLINKYTRTPLREEEVYTFKLILCDNETDRDFEVFSLDALNSLKDLFLGKTGICDHDAKSTNQIARIYKTELEYLDGVNAIGEKKARLIAKAYIPVTEYTKEVISRIESGILKEVSVGCSVKKSKCNICGKEFCSHLKGKNYGGKICIKILCEADDAYEFSFVAIPCQRNAGVNKSFNFKEEKNLTEKLKNLEKGMEITLSFEEANELKKAASWGESYRNSLVDSIKRASMILQPNMDAEIMEEMALSLSMEKLVFLKNYYETELEKKLPVRTQLASKAIKTNENINNGGFKI